MEVVMAICVLFECPGVTQAQYDQALEKVTGGRPRQKACRLAGVGPLVPCRGTHSERLARGRCVGIGSRLDEVRWRTDADPQVPRIPRHHAGDYSGAQFREKLEQFPIRLTLFVSLPGLAGQSSTHGRCLLDRPVKPGDDGELCVPT